MANATPKDILNAVRDQDTKCVPVDCVSVTIEKVEVKRVLVGSVKSTLKGKPEHTNKNGNLNLYLYPYLESGKWIPKYHVKFSKTHDAKGPASKPLLWKDAAWFSPNLNPRTLVDYCMVELKMSFKDSDNAREKFMLFVWEHVCGMKLLDGGTMQDKQLSGIPEEQHTGDKALQPPSGLPEAQSCASGQEKTQTTSLEKAQHPPSFLKVRPKIAHQPKEKSRTVDGVVDDASKQPTKRKISDESVAVAPAKRTRTSKTKGSSIADERSAAKSKGIPWQPPAGMDQNDDEEVQPGHITDDKKLIILIKDEEDVPPKTEMTPAEEDKGDMEDIDFEIEKSQILQAQLQAEKDQLQARMEEVRLKQKKAAMNKKHKVIE